LKRFTANLLFRYSVRGHSLKRALCESRLIELSARSIPAAIAAARRYGKSHSYSHFNPNGELFVLEFLGLIDLIDRTYLERNEVWYSLFQSGNPRARLKPVKKFNACLKGGTVGNAWWMVPRDWAAPADRKPLRSGRRTTDRQEPMTSRKASR
jgi:hypothetical protein